MPPSLHVLPGAENAALTKQLVLCAISTIVKKYGTVVWLCVHQRMLETEGIDGDQHRFVYLRQTYQYKETESSLFL